MFQVSRPRSEIEIAILGLAQKSDLDFQTNRQEATLPEQNLYAEHANRDGASEPLLDLASNQ
jgi:hypothetical protein